MNKIWFKRKTYGWGWTPASWEGWVVLVAYLVIIFILASAVEGESQREVGLFFILPGVIVTAALIRICYKTGESPRWQWGEEKKDKHIS